MPQAPLSLQISAAGSARAPPPWAPEPASASLAALTYRDKFVIICLNIFEYGLKQQEKRKVELDTFNACVQEAVQENREQGKLRIAKFEEKHLLVGPALPCPCPGATLLWVWPPQRAVALSL